MSNRKVMVTGLLAGVLILVAPAFGQHQHDSKVAQGDPAMANCPMHEQHSGMNMSMENSGKGAPGSIKTLTGEQIQGYRSGEGMGLAKAAELNHYPGPRHVLDLADDLNLSPSQRKEAQHLFDEMHAQAVALGSQILTLEEKLDSAFAAHSIDPEQLRLLTTQISDLQGKLRRTHLQAHMAMRAALSEQQIAKYDEMLRGGKM
ncbi:MAG: periplasmic heavy metal sensor [Acidobacteriia bacterium]|nr:periplasmic heavy metal sensor [Terriglobia bacterium]